MRTENLLGFLIEKFVPRLVKKHRGGGKKGASGGDSGGGWSVGGILRKKKLRRSTNIRVKPSHQKQFYRMRQLKGGGGGRGKKNKAGRGQTTQGPHCEGKPKLEVSSN